jgi:hypothetical protein
MFRPGNPYDLHPIDDPNGAIVGAVGSLAAP